MYFRCSWATGSAFRPRPSTGLISNHSATPSRAPSRCSASGCLAPRRALTAAGRNQCHRRGLPLLRGGCARSAAQRCAPATPAIPCTRPGASGFRALGKRAGRLATGALQRPIGLTSAMRKRSYRVTQPPRGRKVRSRSTSPHEDDSPSSRCEPTPLREVEMRDLPNYRPNRRASVRAPGRAEIRFTSKNGITGRCTCGTTA